MLKKSIALTVLAVAAAVLATPATAGVMVTSPDPGIASAAVAPETGVSFSDLSLRSDGLRDASGRVVIDRLGLGHIRRSIGDEGENGTAPMPEPATLLLLGSGLTGLALRRRRRQ